MCIATAGGKGEGKKAGMHNGGDYGLRAGMCSAHTHTHTHVVYLLIGGGDDDVQCNSTRKRVNISHKQTRADMTDMQNNRVYTS